MKLKTWAVWIFVVCLDLFGSGCSRKPEPTVAKGVILSVAYQDADGKTHGFTRLNMASAVPGGNGSWNVDAYGEPDPGLSHHYPSTAAGPWALGHPREEPGRYTIR